MPNEPFEAETVGEVQLKPKNIPLPDKHPITVNDEQAHTADVDTYVNGRPKSGFLFKGEYKPI